MMNGPQAAHAIGQAINKLLDRIYAKQDELHRRESSQGKSHDVRKMNALRLEIESLSKRLELAEKLQDQMLTK